MFDWLLKKLDKESYKFLAKQMWNILYPHFLSLFTQLHENTTRAFLDLIFAYGSGSEHAKYETESDECTQLVLCKTEQLILSFALVLTRHLIYKFKYDDLPFDKLTPQ